MHSQDNIPGFAPPGIASRRRHRRAAIAVELLMSFALIVAIGVAAFVVSMEIAEAGALKSVHASANLAVKVLLLLLFATGGLTAFATVASVTRRKPVDAGR